VLGIATWFTDLGTLEAVGAKHQADPRIQAALAAIEGLCASPSEIRLAEILIPNIDAWLTCRFDQARGRSRQRRSRWPPNSSAPAIRPVGIQGPQPNGIHPMTVTVHRTSFSHRLQGSC